jgi:hypothetical protein
MYLGTIFLSHKVDIALINPKVKLSIPLFLLFIIVNKTI